MSLRTDIVFVKALQSNEGLMASLPAGGVYNPAIPMPEDDVENAPIPYIIVGLSGVQNDDSYKDNDFEGDTDHVQISIIVCAKSREQLGDLTEDVRLTIREYFEEHQDDDSDHDYVLIPQEMVFSAGPVNYDSRKPCFWQELSYNCDTEP